MGQLRALVFVDAGRVMPRSPDAAPTCSRRGGSCGLDRIATRCSVVGQCVHARDGRKPFGALLGAHWLRSETDNHSATAVCDRRIKRPAPWDGRSVIVTIATAIVILAVAAVVMPVLNQ